MQLQIFKFQSGEQEKFSSIRTVDIDGDIWFVASDVAKTLGYKRPSEAVRQHCKEGGTVKHRTPTNSGDQEVLLINEPNVYRLTVRSKLPAAEKFEAWVFDEVLPSIRKKGSYGIDRSATPNFVTRFNDNWQNVEKGYFSVIGELFIRLYGKFEQAGYQIPDKAYDGKEIRPDTSVGRLFSDYLKRHHPELKDRWKYYDHHFKNYGITVQARQYENVVLPIFIEFIDDVWLKERAVGYFKARDSLALDYLPKLLPAEIS